MLYEIYLVHNIVLSWTFEHAIHDKRRMDFSILMQVNLSFYLCDFPIKYLLGNGSQ